MSGTGNAKAQTGIYEPLLPPFHQLSHTNRGPLALLAAVIFFIIASLTFSTKVYMTFATIRKVNFQLIMMTVAMVFALGYTISICQAVQNGLGRVASQLTGSQVQLLSKYYYTSNIMFYLSVAAAKASVTLLVIALKPKRWIALALYGVLGVVGVWAVTAAFVVAFQCGPNRWVLGPTSQDMCIDQYTAQIGLRIVDIVTDLAIIVLPGIMMLYVQLPWTKRLSVTFMFGLRIATPIFTVVTLVRLSGFYNAKVANRPYEAVNPSIWTSVTLNVSIITACLPSIKRVLADWAAGVSNAGISEGIELQHSMNRSRTGYGQPSGLRSLNRSQSGTKNLSQADHETDTATYSYYARKGREDRARDDDDTESKRGLTDDSIMRTVAYTVEYDEEPRRSE